MTESRESISIKIKSETAGREWSLVANEPIFVERTTNGAIIKVIDDQFATKFEMELRLEQEHVEMIAPQI